MSSRRCSVESIQSQLKRTPLPPLFAAAHQADLAKLQLLLKQKHVEIERTEPPFARFKKRNEWPLWIAQRLPDDVAYEGLNTYHGGPFLLHLAAGNGLARDSVDTPDDTRPSPARTECVRLLLRSQAPIDAVDSRGRTALHAAALAGNVGAAKLVVRAGPMLVNMQDNAGSTALHIAAAAGFLELVQFLLLVEADIDIEQRPQNSIDEAEAEGNFANTASDSDADAITSSDGSEAADDDTPKVRRIKTKLLAIGLAQKLLDERVQTAHIVATEEADQVEVIEMIGTARSPEAAQQLGREHMILGEIRERLWPLQKLEARQQKLVDALEARYRALHPPCEAENAEQQVSRDIDERRRRLSRGRVTRLFARLDGRIRTSRHAHYANKRQLTLRRERASVCEEKLAHLTQLGAQLSSPELSKSAALGADQNEGGDAADDDDDLPVVSVSNLRKWGLNSVVMPGPDWFAHESAAAALAEEEARLQSSIVTGDDGTTLPARPSTAPSAWMRRKRDQRVPMDKRGKIVGWRLVNGRSVGADPPRSALCANVMWDGAKVPQSYFIGRNVFTRPMSSTGTHTVESRPLFQLRFATPAPKSKFKSRARGLLAAKMLSHGDTRHMHRGSMCPTRHFNFAWRDELPAVGERTATSTGFDHHRATTQGHVSSMSRAMQRTLARREAGSRGLKAIAAASGSAPGRRRSSALMEALEGVSPEELARGFHEHHTKHANASTTATRRASLVGRRPSVKERELTQAAQKATTQAEMHMYRQQATEELQKEELRAQGIKLNATQYTENRRHI